MNKFIRTRNYLLFFLLSFVATMPATAQKKKHALPLHLSFMVPKALANQGYRSTFSGVFDMGLAFGYGYRNFSLSGFFRTTQFEIPDALFPIRVQTLQAIQNTGIRFGYDYPFADDKFLFTTGIAVGYNWIQYSRIVTLKPESVNRNATAINVSPSIGVCYMIEKGFGFGVEVAYNNMSYVFDPYAIRLNEYKTYTSDQLKGRTATFSFGFSVFCNFLVKSEDSDDDF